MAKVITLGNYKDLEYEMQPIVVTERDIQAELNGLLQANTQIVDVTGRPTAEGDKVNINFAGSIDGVAFDGGTAENYDLVLGSHSFIDNFEEQLTGHNVGEDVDVYVTFPENYGADELAGKKALFQCRINGIKEQQVPELNDEFVSHVSKYTSVDEFMSALQEMIRQNKQEQALAQRAEELLAVVVETSEFEISDEELEAETQMMLRAFEQDLRSHGMSIEQYLEYFHVDMNGLLDQYRPQVRQDMQCRAVLEAIAEAEAIEVTEAEMNEALSQLAGKYQTDVETFKSQINMDMLRTDIASQKAIKYITAK